MIVVAWLLSALVALALSAVQPPWFPIRFRRVFSGLAYLSAVVFVVIGLLDLVDAVSLP